MLLLHGANDTTLAGEIQQHVGHELPLHEEHDPVALKRFLGESHLVIGSRFHALVGALSQGVPAIGTSRSHKYEMLFDEYGCSDMLLPVPADAGAIRERVELATGAARSHLLERIRKRGTELVNQTKAMWEQVNMALEVPWHARAASSTGKT